MKKLRILFAVSTMALLTACGTTKTNTSETQTNNSNRGRSNTQVSTNSTTATSTRQDTSTNRAVNTNRTNRANTGAAVTNEAVYEARTQKMYTDLNMDPTQIGTYELNWKNAETTWKRSNRNQSMNNFERIELEDRILKDLLNDTQFTEYQAWARENAMPAEE
jgi:hypothetical protein